MIEESLLNNKYKIINRQDIKQGVFGVVFKATIDKSDDIFAIKELKERIGSDGIDPTVYRQNSILKFMGNNNNVVKLIQSFYIEDRVFLVFPYIDMNLRDLMCKQFKNKIPPKIRRQIMRQLLTAIRAAHTARFMHRDIKPQNILVVKSKDNPQNFVIKLADWGSSRKLNTCADQKFTQQVIPPGYKPPQLLFGTTKYTQTVDIWSIGILFSQLIFGKRIFTASSMKQLLQVIIYVVGLSQVQDCNWIINRFKTLQYEFPLQLLQKLKKTKLDLYYQKQIGKPSQELDLLKKLLRIHPQKRISALDALKHPYFDLNY